MQFIFFDQAGKTLFVRRDAEQATWTVETLSMVASFPYDVQKVIQQAMRVGFEDETGVLQPFEIRKVETMEPDHYQRVTCEHIAISELTDRHMQERELTNVTAQAALSGILSGTGWNVGNVAASGTSSADLSLGSVWQNVRTIESNWNVYITPRVTYNTSGITGKYLDIAPAQGTWRGIRLSLDKNADEMGVVIDDTEVKTALYGYGASTDGVPLTFASAVWSKTSAHPAKPSGQTYLEDADATADYGRNGAARFGFYQNADITDAATLLEKTWEALKATNAPRVTVNCMVRDLYRLGYADEPIRLHDTALVQIRQTHTNLQLEIIQLTVDLLDPTATRPTIGAYIPNIVYIQRDTGREASGGASNTLSGRRGGGGSGGKSAKENQLSEFETEIRQNQYQISLRAYQRDVTNMENILKEAGVAIDASGVIIYAGNNLTQMKSAIQVNADGITSEVTNRQNADATLQSQITQTADQIALKVSKGDVSTQLAVECGNVSISGGNLVVSGYITSQGLITTMGNFNGNISATGSIAGQSLAGGSITLNGESLTSHSITWMAGSLTMFAADQNLDLRHSHAVTVGSDGTVTLGEVSSTGGSFNIADTKTYKNGVSAAWTNAYNTVRINNNKNPGAGNKTINLGSGQSVEVYAQAKSNANASIWTTVGTVTVNAPTYTLGSLSIASNGIYNAPTYGYTGFSYVSVDVPAGPTITQCYTRNFSVSSISKYGDGYEVVGSVYVRVEFSDNTHTDYGPYTVRDVT